MNVHTKKSASPKSRAVANNTAKVNSSPPSIVADNRTEATAQRKLQNIIHHGQEAKQLKIKQLARKHDIQKAQKFREAREYFFQDIRDSVERGAGDDNDEMAREDASPLANMAELIETDYPVGKFVYVGVGSSPGVLLELLHLRGARTITLPVSGVKEAIPKTPEEEARAIKYLNKQLADYAYQPVNLLLLDATDTNATLKNITHLIQTSDARKKISRQIRSTSITQSKTFGMDVREKIPGSDIDILHQDDSDTRTLMRMRFFYREYKDILGNTTNKVPLKEIIAGKNPDVLFNMDDLQNIMRFAKVAHGHLKPEMLESTEE